MNMAMSDAIDDTITFYMIGGQYLVPGSAILENADSLNLEDSINITSAYNGLTDVGYRGQYTLVKGKMRPEFVKYWHKKYGGWKPTEENMRTDVIREKVAYKKNIKVKRIVNDYLKNTDDVLVKILKHPTVTNAKIIDGEIKIDVDFEILAEVIGETKMQVTVFTPVTQEEDIDDLDIEVNEDFLG